MTFWIFVGVVWLIVMLVIILFFMGADQYDTPTIEEEREDD